MAGRKKAAAVTHGQLEVPKSIKRQCPKTPAPCLPICTIRETAIDLSCLPETPDHLLEKPKPGHRYLNAAGRALDDGRYQLPPLRLRLPCPVPPPRIPQARTTTAQTKTTLAGRVEKAQVRARGQPGIRVARLSPRSLANLSAFKPAVSQDEEDTFHNKPMINIVVPDHIQAMLVDDWENITKNNQLVPLPHPKPVTKIFEDYLAFERPRREEGSSSMDILEEVIAGFREYFEKALSRILLYRFERHQHMDLRRLWEEVDDSSQQHKGVCDVYGAEHLARLIVSLPELLAQTNMDQQSVSRLREEIGKFTAWLGRNCESYFVSEYETPSQEYIDKARSF